MDNIDEQAYSIEQSFTDNHWQLPSEYGYPMDIHLPPCATQPQNLLTYQYSSPLPSPATAERFAVSTGRLSYGGLCTPSAARNMDFTMVSNPEPCQSQWSGTLSSNLTHETHASVPPLQSQHQTPYKRLCGWSRDYEPWPVPPVPPGIPSIPHSLSPGPTLTHSSPNVGQYDAWMRQVLDGSMNTCASSPDGDTDLSASGFLGAFADYDCVPDAYADSQPSVALTTHNAMSSIQSTASPYKKPSYGPYREPRFFECQWLSKGALCEMHVTADRRSVVGHLQRVHGIKPGEEKARETCLWEQCGMTLNKESLARHILTVHLKGRVHCAKCNVFFAREDSLKRHLKGGQHNVPPDKSAARQSSRSRVMTTSPTWGTRTPNG